MRSGPQPGIHDPDGTGTEEEWIRETEIEWVASVGGGGAEKGGDDRNKSFLSN